MKKTIEIFILLFGLACLVTFLKKESPTADRRLRGLQFNEFFFHPLSTRLHFSGPIASAPSYQFMRLPTTTATLIGTATATGGATIASVKWTLVVDPTAGGVTTGNSTTNTASISGMSIWGNYLWKFKVTDNNGLSDSCYSRIKLAPAPNNSAKVKYNLTGSGGEIYQPTGNRSTAWRGGDTLVLPNTGTATDIIFGNLSGDPEHHLVIVGPATGTATTLTLRFDDHCQYIDVIGNHKIKVAAIGMGLCNNIYITGVDIDGTPLAGQGQTGLICKKHIAALGDGSIDPESIREGYLMDTLTFDHMVCKRSDGEMFYVGSTAPNGGDGQGPDGYFPVMLAVVTFSYIQCDSSGWDGIQLSGALYGNSIVHCKVTHYGLVNMGSQQAGIIFGGSCSGYMAYDTVINGSGNGVELFGYGILNVHHLYLDSCGRDSAKFGDPNEQQTVFCKGIPSIFQSNPNQQIQFYDCYIKNPKLAGAFVQNNDNGAVTAALVYNNHFCIPGANPSTWTGTYINGSPSPTVFNNVLFCGQLNTFQFCRGCKIILHQ